MASYKGLRIAFCGAHGVGKTALATALAAQLNLPYIQSPARRVHAKYGVLPHTAKLLPPLEYVALQDEIMQTIKADYFASADTGAVFDRSVVDAVAYGLLNNQTASALPKNYVDVHVRPYPLLNPKNVYYDLLFYVPIYRAVPADGVRELDEHRRYVLDCIMFSILERYCPAVFVRTVPNAVEPDTHTFVLDTARRLLS